MRVVTSNFNAAKQGNPHLAFRAETGSGECNMLKVLVSLSSQWCSHVDGFCFVLLGFLFFWVHKAA